MFFSYWGVFFFLTRPLMGDKHCAKRIYAPFPSERAAYRLYEDSLLRLFAPGLLGSIRENPGTN